MRKYLTRVFWEILPREKNSEEFAERARKGGKRKQKRNPDATAREVILIFVGPACFKGVGELAKKPLIGTAAYLMYMMYVPLRREQSGDDITVGGGG